MTTSHANVTDPVACGAVCNSDVNCKAFVYNPVQEMCVTYENHRCDTGQRKEYTYSYLKKVPVSGNDHTFIPPQATWDRQFEAQPNCGFGNVNDFEPIEGSNYFKDVATALDCAKNCGFRDGTAPDRTINPNAQVRCKAFNYEPSTSECYLWSTNTCGEETRPNTMYSYSLFQVGADSHPTVEGFTATPNCNYL